jgi:hypothetical protein
VDEEHLSPSWCGSRVDQAARKAAQRLTLLDVSCGDEAAPLFADGDAESGAADAQDKRASCTPVF